MYEPEKIEQAVHYAARNFGTSYFENLGNGSFRKKVLDHYAQLSSTNTIIVRDFNQDQHLDLLLAGNLYSSEVETSRNDAGYGVFLAGDGTGNFTIEPSFETGLFLQGDIKSSATIRLADGGLGLLFAANMGRLQLVRLHREML